MNHFTDPEPESSCETRVQQWFEQFADESSHDSDLTPFDVGEHNLPLIHNDELLTLDKDNTPMFDSDSDSNITLPDPYKNNLPCLDDPHDKLQFSIKQYLMDYNLDFPGPDGRAGGRSAGKVCLGCISETVRCRKLILGRDIG